MKRVYIACLIWLTRRAGFYLISAHDAHELEARWTIMRARVRKTGDHTRTALRRKLRRDLTRMRPFMRTIDNGL